MPASSAPLRGLARRLAPLLGAAAEALYPPVCIACRAETATPHGLCGDCFREAWFIDSPLCDRCGAPLHGATDAPFCDHCLGVDFAFGRARAAMAYEGVGRRLALQLKHGDRLELAQPLGRWMARAGRPLLREADLIVPVPLHWTRLLRRRSNQAAELARRVSALTGVPVAPDLMRRVRRTPPQKGLGREERRANLAGAFAVRPGREPAGLRVLLVDDVFTTGATLSACAAVLRDAGAAGVDALCLARVASEPKLSIFTGFNPGEDP